MTYSGFLIFALIEPAVLPKLVPVTVMVCASADPDGSGAVPVIDSIPGQRYLNFFAPLVFEFMFEFAPIWMKTSRSLPTPGAAVH